MMQFSEKQQKLMELVVEKVLQKHEVVDKEKHKLTSEEKKKVAEIVEGIKQDVATFLENSQTKKTEKDFPQEKTVKSTELIERASRKLQSFTQDNDVTSVKTFFNKNQE